MEMTPALDFHQLQAFLAVARAKNFTRAAERVNTSQSALSRAIQRLEEQLGQPLFERKPREVALTEFGAWFQERAQRILDQVEDTVSEVAEYNKKGRIRLGAIPTIAPYFLPGILRTFAEIQPNVSIVVHEDTTAQLLRRCSLGEIDLAILAQPIDAQYLQAETLFTEELWLVLPQSHPLVDSQSVHLSDLKAHPFVMLNEAHCLSENISSFCQRQSVQFLSIEKISQLATVQELVTLGHGVSMVPEMAARIDPSDQRVYRQLTGERPTRTIVMVWNPYRFVSQWVKALQGFLRGQFGES